MEKIKGNKKLLYGILIVFIFIVSVGVSYAWFSAVVNGNSSDMIVTTGTLRLEYTDSKEVVAEDIFPGEKIIKTFKVENVGTLEAICTINLTEVTNTFLNDELVYKLEREGELINSGVVPIYDESLKEGITINPEELHEYTLTIEFIETSSAQDYNQGQSFYGVIQIDDESSGSNGLRLSLYLDEKRVSSLPEDGTYLLSSYTCDNGGLISYDKVSNKVYSASDATDENCTLNFISVENQLLLTHMLSNDIAYPDNEPSEFVTGDNGVKFTEPSSDTNGKGLYYTEEGTEDNKRVYYYRGAVENNYVYFAGYCWRIVRTNENDSIRLRYGGNGTVGSDGKVTCPKTGTAVNIGAGKVFNGTINSAKYFGYTYGNETNSSGTQLYGSTPSNAKTLIDTWYKTNIVDKNQDKPEVVALISNASYCADRSNPQNPTSGSATSWKFYGVMNRLVDYNAYNGSWHGASSNAHPQYVCPESRDNYTLSENAGGTSGYGNELLTYPIALLTADEAAYAGGEFYNVDNSSNNSSYYLYTGENYWTMSPSTFTGSGTSEISVHQTGRLDLIGVEGDTQSLVPVLSIKNSAIVESGTGLQTDAYVIK